MSPFRYVIFALYVFKLLYEVRILLNYYIFYIYLHSHHHKILSSLIIFLTLKSILFDIHIGTLL